MRRVALAVLMLAGISYAVPVPQVSVAFSEATSPQQVATTLQIVLLLTLLALAPAFLIMLTSFTRIVLVLGFLRRALGTQQIPPNQVLLSLALFLTIFTMMPVFQRINDDALKPYLAQKSR